MTLSENGGVPYDFPLTNQELAAIGFKLKVPKETKVPIPEPTIVEPTIVEPELIATETVAPSDAVEVVNPVAEPSLVEQNKLLLEKKSELLERRRLLTEKPKPQVTEQKIEAIETKVQEELKDYKRQLREEINKKKSDLEADKEAYRADKGKSSDIKKEQEFFQREGEIKEMENSFDAKVAEKDAELRRVLDAKELTPLEEIEALKKQRKNLNNLWQKEKNPLAKKAKKQAIARLNNEINAKEKALKDKLKAIDNQIEKTSEQI